MSLRFCPTSGHSGCLQSHALFLSEVSLERHRHAFNPHGRRHLLGTDYLMHIDLLLSLLGAPLLHSLLYHVALLRFHNFSIARRNGKRSEFRALPDCILWLRPRCLDLSADRLPLLRSQRACIQGLPSELFDAVNLHLM